MTHRNYLYAFPEPLTPDTFANYPVAELPSAATVYGCVDQTVRRLWLWLLQSCEA